MKEVTHDVDEFAHRQESDFLLVNKHEGKIIYFHSLRHTCGEWMAMTGAHLNVVQQVM